MLQSKRLALKLLLALTIGAAQAQSSVTLIVPFPPGGGLDALARMLGQTLTEQKMGTFVVDNKPGANGMLGAKLAAAAKPDGSTWLIVDGAVFTVNPFLYPRDPAFEAERDLQAVRALGHQPAILVVNPASGIKSITEFVDGARKNALSYASGGIGSAGHLTMEYFGKTAGLKLNHIPYKGGAPAMNDLLSGQVQAAFVALPIALPHVKSGKLTALAVSGRQRASQLPGTPTVAESGYPGFELETSYYVMLPRKVPGDVSAAIDRKVQGVLADAATRERMRGVGIEPAQIGHDETVKGLAEDKRKLEKLIRDNNIKAE